MQDRSSTLAWPSHLMPFHRQEGSLKTTAELLTIWFIKLDFFSAQILYSWDSQSWIQGGKWSLPRKNPVSMSEYLFSSPESVTKQCNYCGPNFRGSCRGDYFYSLGVGKKYFLKPSPKLLWGANMNTFKESGIWYFFLFSWTWFSKICFYCREGYFTKKF